MHAPNPTLVADRIDIEAWRDLFRSAPPPLARALGLEVTPAGPGVLLSSTGLDHLLFNRGLALGGSDARITSAALDALRHFERRSIDRFLLEVSSDTGGGGTALRRLGLEPYRRRWLKMLREDATPPEPVETPLALGDARPDEAATCADILAAGFDIPEAARPLLAGLVGRERWELVVARDGGEPVAVGALFVKGTVGHLAFAATRPSHRRRRAQRALMAERVRRALARGCRLVVTETGEPLGDEPNPSLANMRRLGFRPIGARRGYALPGTSWLRATGS